MVACLYMVESTPVSAVRHTDERMLSRHARETKLPYRYFFALFPDHEARESITEAAANLKSALSLSGRLIDKSRLHLTWQFIGTLHGPQSEVEEIAIAAGDGVKCSQFEFALDRALSFDPDSDGAACVFEVSTPPAIMERVAHQLRRATANAVIAEETRFPFRPHVTWLYSENSIAGHVVISPIVWRVCDFCLVLSISERMEYRIIRRWPLSC